MKKFNPILKVCLLFLAPFAILCGSSEKVSAQDTGYDRHKCFIESQLYEVDATRSSGLKMTYTATYLITGREGTIYSTAGIGYQKGDKVDIHYARIEDMNGNVVRELRKSDIHDRQAVSSGAMYMDHFIKYFELLHNRYPYRLVYSYTVIHRRYISLIDIVESGHLPLLNSVVSLTVPQDKEIDMKYGNVSEPEVARVDSSGQYIDPQDPRTDYNTKYTWKYSYHPPVPEIRSYGESIGMPKIVVNPVEFEYGVKGSMATWESYGNWLYALNEGLDELPESEQYAIITLLAGVDDDLEKMKILYRYMQERNRYVNVSMNIGGLKSYPASYVCANRYGDCKALATYMRAMLKFIGIECYTVSVWSGHTHPEVRDDFPSHDFNHVINVIPYKGDTIYMECTSKNVPFGYIHSDIQGRKALLRKKSGSHLIDIPAMQAEDVKCLYGYDIAVDGDGNAAVHIDRMLHGENYEFFDGLANSLDKMTVDKYIRDNIYSGNYELTGYDIVKEDREQPEISFTADFTTSGFLRIYGKNAVISNFPLYIPPFEHPDKRRSYVEIAISSYDEYTLTYDIPSIAPGALPKPVKIESKYGAYEANYSLDGGKLVVSKSILLNAGIYPLDEYPDFYDFISRVRKEERSKLNISIL